jgi:hypothetical protein
MVFVLEWPDYNRLYPDVTDTFVQWQIERSSLNIFYTIYIIIAKNKTDAPFTQDASVSESVIYPIHTF